MNRIALLGALVLAGTSARAEPLAERYETARNAALPAKFERSKVMRLLLNNTWLPLDTPQIAAGPAPSGTPMKPFKLRFMRPSKLAAMMTPKKGEAIVFVRGVERRESAIVVNVDGQAWQLATCEDKKRRACLIPSSNPFTP